MRVAVTGATGFIGSEVTKTLLERGHTVHGTARNPDDESKVSPLTDLPGATERLTLFRANLLSSEGFGPAFEGCDVVMHLLLTRRSRFSRRRGSHTGTELSSHPAVDPDKQLGYVMATTPVRWRIVSTRVFNGAMA